MAAGHARATEAAVRLLSEGGSAVDAAIGADAVMGVVEPTGTGVGGDLMAVVATGEGVSVLNGSGRSGRRTDPETVPDNGHGFVPSVGGWAVTVPGAVAAWEDLHGRFGRLSWPSLFEPAIEAATDGVEVGATGSRLWEGSRGRLDAAGEALYFPDGAAPAPGQRWRNPALAAVLEQIATDGPDAPLPGPAGPALGRCDCRRGREPARRRPLGSSQPLGGAAAGRPGRPRADHRAAAVPGRGHGSGRRMGARPGPAGRDRR